MTKYKKLIRCNPWLALNLLLVFTYINFKFEDSTDLFIINFLLGFSGLAGLFFTWAIIRSLDAPLLSKKISKFATKASKIALSLYAIVSLSWFSATYIYASDFYVFSKEKKSITEVSVYLDNLKNFQVTSLTEEIQKGDIKAEFKIFNKSTQTENFLRIHFDKPNSQMTIDMEPGDKNMRETINNISSILSKNNSRKYEIGITVESLLLPPPE